MNQPPLKGTIQRDGSNGKYVHSKGLYQRKRRSLSKRETRRFSKKSASPPFCENPLKSKRHLVYPLAIWKQIAKGPHTSVSGLLFTIQLLAMAIKQICNLFPYRNAHFKPRMLLLSVGNDAMNARRNWQLRNELHRHISNFFPNSQQPYEMAL
jgi:hypothetical protein